ncbi:hypothetical protein [Brevundimonas sp.]|uniref:hypothetical protein n=1 Tax=Brevundimonas sp. TaxID=1871086 RepID=UPI002ABABA6D|nr:hypothetical protein [Brevundimonas sp.]MDZ4362875.1 hypothetical protein [Brevundimonas sp.]
MTFETHTELTNTADARLDGRAVWAAPVLECFDAVSAEVGGAIGGDEYAVS